MQGDERNPVLRLQSRQVNALVIHDLRPGPASLPLGLGPAGPRGSESGRRQVSRGAIRMDGIMRGLMSAASSSNPVW